MEKFSPLRCDQSKFSLLVEFEDVITRDNPHNVRYFKERLEANTFFAGATGSSYLGTLSDPTDSLDIFFGKAGLVAVNTKAVTVVGQNQCRHGDFIGVIVCIL